MRLPSLWRGRDLPSRVLREDFVDRFFNDFFGNLRQPSSEATEFIPDVDVVERDNGYVVKAELPGVALEDVTIDVVGNNLEIRGEKRSETEKKEENYYSSERSYGSFVRTIPLPAEIDAEKIEACLCSGVLEITCPKIETARRRQIQVKGEAPKTIARTGTTGAPKAEKPRAREEREKRPT